MLFRSVLTGQTNSTITFYPNHNYTPGDYQLIMSNGCTTDTSSITHLRIGQTPLVNITRSPLPPYCSGDTIILSAQGTALTSYEWYPGNLNSQSIPVYSNANFFVIVYDTNGCSNSASLNITFGQSPIVPEILQSGNTLMTGNSLSSIQWYFNGSPIAGTQFITPSQAGNYSVTQIGRAHV